MTISELKQIARDLQMFKEYWKDRNVYISTSGMMALHEYIRNNGTEISYDWGWIETTHLNNQIGYQDAILHQLDELCRKHFIGYKYCLVNGILEVFCICYIREKWNKVTYTITGKITKEVSYFGLKGASPDAINTIGQL